MSEGEVRPLFVVTGASGTIGGWIAKALVEMGCEVEGWSRRRVAPAGVTAVSVDLTDSKALYETCERVAYRTNLVGIVHAAAAFEGEACHEVAMSIPEILLNDHLGLGEMLKRNSGDVLLVSSRAVDDDTHSQYAFSKNKMELYAMTLADDLAPCRVNVLRLGHVVGTKTWPSSVKRVAEGMSLRRMCEKDDILTFIVYWLQQSYMTGTTVMLDGGVDLSKEGA